MKTDICQASFRVDGEDIPSDEYIQSAQHCLKVEVSLENDYATITFETRLAMREFARLLLHASMFSTGESIEMAPLSTDGKEMHLTSGARLTLDSSRLFLFFPRR